MKRTLLFLLLCCCLNALQAQNWCPPGATWYYRVYQPNSATGYSDGHIKLTVTNTLLVNGIVCQNMEGVYTGATQPGAPVTTINSYLNYQTYENNNTVLIYDPSTHVFDTIADFNALIGDRWLMIRWPFMACANNPTRIPMTVTDTGHVSINNISLKQLKVSLPSASGSYTLALTQRIISTSGPLFPFIYSTCVTDGVPLGDFVCYSDSTFPTYDPSGAVCAYLPDGIEERQLGKTGLTIYPNPNQGLFMLDLSQATRVDILSATGAVVYSKFFDQGGKAHLDVSGLSPGLYYIRAENTSAQGYSKFNKE